ncbi:MAG: hypothetical protein M5R36_00095 [Deltaproteobacteria bacterium]|nr:hypothetical protein [Deltaproteobacteria bacterium]
MHARAASPGPLSEEEQHERFQETGVLRAQHVDNGNIAALADAIAAWHLGGRVVLLLDAPAAEAIQADLWERDPLFPGRKLI